MNRYHTAIYNSPAGPLQIVTGNGHLLMCDWIDSPRHNANLAKIGLNHNIIENAVKSPEIEATISWLDAYFSHSPLPALPPVTPEGTPFMKDVWQALAGLSRGHTISYTCVAALSGHPSAVRAVASAIAANPVSIIIPCHLVTRSDGSIGKYAGGSDAKKLLIDHELSLQSTP